MKNSQKIKVLILGSTGSVGTQTLDVLSKHKDKFQVFGLVCNKDANTLKVQAKKYSIPNSHTCLTSKNPQKVYGLIKNKNVDVVVNTISGSQGLKPSIATLEAGKTLALANKESVVLDGEKLKKLEKKYSKNNSKNLSSNNSISNLGKGAKKGARILPLDSEHHAILRLLQTRGLKKFDPKQIKKITITASGGPFFGYTEKQLASATLKDALSNPNWNMGPKITLESATLLNKGYELIEAHHLFSVPFKNLDAIIDRKSFVHAIIEFKKTKTHPKETLALAYKPDMRVVIEDTLLSLYYEKLNKKFTNKKIKILTTKELKTYKFNKIDHSNFPALKAVLEAFKKNKIKIFYKKKESQIENILNKGLPFSSLLTKKV